MTKVVETIYVQVLIAPQSTKPNKKHQSSLLAP
jgi:hypothetical protein